MRAASKLLVVAMLLAGSEARPQDELPSIDAAVASVRAGVTVDGRISAAIAREAVESVDAASSPTALRELALVAEAGGAHVALARRLVRLTLEGPESLSASALDLLARRLSPASLDEALGPSRLAWDAALLALATKDEARARRALSLLVRDAEPRVLLTLLASAEVTNARRLQLLRDLDTTRRPREMLDAFSRAELEPELFEPFCSSLSALVARDDEAAMLALDLVARGSWGWGAALLRALGSLPPALHDRGAPFVLHALETASGYRLAAAVIAATRLRLPELGPQLVDLARDPESREVRVAAIRAIPVLRHRDPETLDLLIDLLADPEVSNEAHRALLRQSGVRLPLQRQPWVDWRRNELSAEGQGAPAVAPAVAAPTAPAEQRVAPPSTVPDSTPAGLVVLVGLVACGTLLLLRRPRRVEARPAPPGEACSAPTEQAPHPDGPALPGSATRLERLGARLHDDPRTEAYVESEAQLLLLRGALNDGSSDATEPATTPRLPPLDALREIQRLASALEKGAPSADTFEVVRASVEPLERALPGGGFTELGRECCFLLVQVAYQLSRGATLDPAVKARLLSLLEDVDRHLAEAAARTDPRTVDVTDVFPPPDRETTHGVSRSRTATLDHFTVDVTIAFPPPEPDASASAPLARPRVAKDAPTLDVQQVFPQAPPESVEVR